MRPALLAYPRGDHRASLSAISASSVRFLGQPSVAMRRAMGQDPDALFESFVKAYVSCAARPSPGDREARHDLGTTTLAGVFSIGCQAVPESEVITKGGAIASSPRLVPPAHGAGVRTGIYRGQIHRSVAEDGEIRRSGSKRARDGMVSSAIGLWCPTRRCARFAYWKNRVAIG